MGIHQNTAIRLEIIMTSNSYTGVASACSIDEVLLIKTLSELGYSVDVLNTNTYKIFLGENK